MKNLFVKYIPRMILTILLLYGVYTETGKWTTLSLFLIFIAIEILMYLQLNEKEKKSLWLKGGGSDKA